MGALAEYKNKKDKILAIQKAALMVTFSTEEEVRSAGQIKRLTLARKLIALGVYYNGLMSSTLAADLVNRTRFTILSYIREENLKYDKEFKDLYDEMMGIVNDPEMVDDLDNSTEQQIEIGRKNFNVVYTHVATGNVYLGLEAAIKGLVVAKRTLRRYIIDGLVTTERSNVYSSRGVKVRHIATGTVYPTIKAASKGEYKMCKDSIWKHIHCQVKTPKWEKV